MFTRKDCSSTSVYYAVGTPARRVYRVFFFFLMNCSVVFTLCARLHRYAQCTFSLDNIHVHNNITAVIGESKFFFIIFNNSIMFTEQTFFEPERYVYR